MIISTQVEYFNKIVLGNKKSIIRMKTGYLSTKSKIEDLSEFKKEKENQVNFLLEKQQFKKQEIERIKNDILTMTTLEFNNTLVLNTSRSQIMLNNKYKENLNLDLTKVYITYSE